MFVLNQNWPRYLAEQRRTAEQDKVEALGRQVESAYKILDTLGLGQASDVSQVIQQVCHGGIVTNHHYFPVPVIHPYQYILHTFGTGKIQIFIRYDPGFINIQLPCDIPGC